MAACEAQTFGCSIKMTECERNERSARWDFQMNAGGGQEASEERFQALFHLSAWRLAASSQQQLTVRFNPAN